MSVTSYDSTSTKNVILHSKLSAYYSTQGDSDMYRYKEKQKGGILFTPLPCGWGYEFACTTATETFNVLMSQL